MRMRHPEGSCLSGQADCPTWPARVARVKIRRIASAQQSRASRHWKPGRSTWLGGCEGTPWLAIRRMHADNERGATFQDQRPPSGKRRGGACDVACAGQRPVGAQPGWSKASPYASSARTTTSAPSAPSAPGSFITPVPSRICARTKCSWLSASSGSRQFSIT